MSVPSSLTATNGCGSQASPVVGIISPGGAIPRGSLRGWWKVDDLDAYADGASITTWPDASGNGYDFTTDVDATADPVIDAGVTLNGYRGLKFSPNVARDSMSADSSGLYTSCVRAGTVLWLCRRHTASTTAATAGAPIAGSLSSGSTNGSHWPYLSDGLSYDGTFRHTQSRVNNLSLGAWTGTTYLVEISSSSAGWEMRRDGTAVASTTESWPVGSISGVTDAGITEFRIGGNVANGFYGHPAHYWEVIAYDAPLATSERSQIHSYLNTKYGLSLP